MRTNKHKVLEHFLQEVDEQIGYQPMHAAINEELRGHVEDKAEMYMDFGLEEEIAFEKAVRDMGDASALGIQLNDAHHLRVAKPLLMLIIALTCIGFLGNIADGGIFAFFDSLYFLWGITVLAVVMWRGYPTLLKYTDKVLKLFLIGLLAFVVIYFVPRIFGSDLIPHQFFCLYSPSVRYGVLQLSIPMAAVILYRNRRNGLKGIGFIFIYEALLILLIRLTHMADAAFIPIITMLISCTGIMIYMIAKDYMPISKLKGMISAVLGTFLLLALFCGIQWKDVSENLQLFMNPNERASVSDAWDDSYNNVLIRELLGKAELVGETPISQEELVCYKTAQWYYEDGEGNWNNGNDSLISLEDNIRYELQDADNLEIEDVLPQHYLNNYRITYWILKHGMIPAILPISLIIAAQIAMFWVAFQIKNRLGRLAAMAGCFAFAVQNVFYFLGNFGFQFGKFGNLPFISEGLVSITGTMIMAGLILSAYRFDTVMKEEK